MTSSSNIILKNCSNEKSGSSIPVSTNMIIDSPIASLNNSVSTRHRRDHVFLVTVTHGHDGFGHGHDPDRNNRD
ncbi:unnamed protein product, partial [Rotaria magnacalcarata]